MINDLNAQIKILDIITDLSGSVQSCTNRNEQGTIIKNGGYRCVCRSNWAGELCNIDCDNKKGSFQYFEIHIDETYF